mgnify:CR=1 FL=1
MLFAAPGVAQTAFDSKHLVGEWVGQWKSGAGSSGNVYLTVETVDGDKVRGSLFIAVATPGQGYYNRDVPFFGVFDGTELAFMVPPSLVVSVRVSGDGMRGFVRGQQTNGTLELDRKN